MDLRSAAHALGGEVSAGQILCPGPNHSKKDRSLSVKFNGANLKVFSHAGDDWRDCLDHVRSRLGMPAYEHHPKGDPISNMNERHARAADEAEPKANGTNGDNGTGAKHRYTASYIYRLADGTPYLRVSRTEPKGPFPQSHWNGSLWVSGKPAGPKVPYRLPELLAAPDVEVFVVEGEKDANRLAGLGLVVTTNSEGAGCWTSDLNPHFAGRRVFILADNDDAGAKHAEKVAENLVPVAAEVRIVNLPGLPEKGDVSDWLDAGGDAATLVALCRAAARYQPGEAGFAGAADASGWLEPKPLPSGLLAVMSFDPDTIPVSIGPWVADIADRMQCPPDFVAIPAVVALASTLGRKIAIRPQSRTDWQEVPNLWGCIVGRPGAMKSPAMAEALKPLNRMEAEARKINEEELKRHAVLLMAHKLRAEEGQKAARAAVKAGSHDISGHLDIDEPEKPAAKRFIVGDTTYEALGEILVSNPNGILAFRDELVSLLKTLDREEYVNARGFFLTGWNGTSGYPFDRISRGSTYIDAVCISLLGSTQPGRLSEYLSRVVKDTAGNDGLLQRFALLVWPDDTGSWKEVDRYADTQARTTAWDTFTRLNLLRPDDVGATAGEYDSIPSLRLGEAARGLFGEWREDLEARLRSGTMHSALESHLAKYRKLVPTLALLNHLADGGHGPVVEVAMLRAIAFSEYLESHARRAYASGTQNEAATAKAILARIRKGDLAGDFTARDIQRHDWSNLSDKDQIAAGLDLLDDLDWIRGAKSTTGGRPRVVYSINPRGQR